ncbi:hypothetical protein WJX73_008085 [Symbiochloris irregularis]|uniref:MYND-type domain-containing protein n=1 Tax=Symbiochloris irregularis TaxID=706552 RepID=A0AAW1P7B3_9CHLO
MPVNICSMSAAYDDGMSYMDDDIERQAGCDFVRIGPAGRYLPPGAMDFTTTPPWRDMVGSGGFRGKRLGLLRECPEFAHRPDYERQLMADLLWTARFRLRHAGGLKMLQEFMCLQPECFALVSWPSLAAFKATTRAEEETRRINLTMMALPYKLSQSENPATREDPLANFKLPPRTPYHFLTVFRIKHGADDWVCAEWLFLLPFPLGKPAPMVGLPSPLPPSTHPFAVMLNEDEGRMRMLAGKCSHCGREDGKRYLCTACGQHSYCGKECQLARWKQHKKLCRLQSKLYAESNEGPIRDMLREGNMPDPRH